jgi:hypothetical protein
LNLVRPEFLPFVPLHRQRLGSRQDSGNGDYSGPEVSPLRLSFLEMSTKLEYKGRTVELSRNGDRYVITVNGKIRDVSSGTEAETVLKSMQLIDAEDAKPKLKRGRPPLPKDQLRRRVFIRLQLPPEEQWLEMLREAGYERQTDFFQTMVDWFLESQPEGKR